MNLSKRLLAVATLVDLNSRVIDVIEKAVLKDNANTDYLNLSKKLKDGDVIIIYSNDYIESLKKENIVYFFDGFRVHIVANISFLKQRHIDEITIIYLNNTLLLKYIKHHLLTKENVEEAKSNYDSSHTN